MNSLHDRGMADRMFRPLPLFTVFCIAVIFLLAMVGPVSASLPSISSISPTSGTSVGGTTVTVNGNHFTDNATAGNTVSAVNFGTTPGTGLNVISNTKLTIISPAHSAGTVDVRVITTGSGISSTTYFDRFTYWVAPTVSSAATNTAGTTITITFSHDMNSPSSQQSHFKYQINGGGDQSISAVSRRISPHHNQFNLTTSGTPIACSDTVTISYTPGSVTSDDGHPLAGFTGQAVTNNMQCPLPTDISSAGVTGFTAPAIGGTPQAFGALSVAAGDTGKYTVTGLTWVPTDNPYLGSTVYTATVTLTSATGYKFPVGGIAFPTADGSPTSVGVGTTSGGDVTGNTLTFDVTFPATAAPPPVVTGLSPTTGPVAGGTPVTISGTGFAGTSEVDFGTYPASILTVSDTEITVTSSGQVAPGMQDVRVTAPGGTSAIVAADQFTYGGPILTGLSPTTGGVYGGTPVTISGTGFVGTSEVDFGTYPASILTVSDTTITVTSSGQLAPGMQDVRVIGPYGTSAIVAADQFTYGGPILTGLSPATGPVAGGTSVTISGTGFAGASEVDFGTYPASILTVSDTTITVTSSGQVAPGMQDVRVITPFGTSAVVAADQFTYT